MENIVTAVRCNNCNKPVKGRSDKKFCDEQCRNTYNNRIRSDRNNTIRNINAALSKNRRILEKTIPPGEQMNKVSRNELLARGFLSNYHTHTQVSAGAVYKCCYDFGWAELENEGVWVKKVDCEGWTGRE